MSEAQQQSTEMPFAKLVREAEVAEAERLAKEHDRIEAEHANTPGWVGKPEQNQPPAEKLSDAPLVQFMLEQEAAVARDHAEGRISDADYQSFRDMTETRIGEVREHLQDAGKDMVEGIREWGNGDLKDAVEHLKEEQPNLVAELESGHPKLEAVADTLDLIGAIKPVIDVALDGVDEIVEVVGDDMPSMARDFVDARARMEGVDPAEIEAAQGKLETVAGAFEAKIEEAHDALGAAHEKIDAEFETFGEAVDQMHDYAEAHPDVEVHTQIHDAQIDEEIEEETGVVDA